MTEEEKKIDANLKKQAKLDPAQQEQEEVKLDPERREEVLNQSISSLGSDENLTPTLEKAIGMTKEWDNRRRAAEEDVRKRFFKGRDDDFKRYLEWKTPSDVPLRDSIRRYEESQTRQFIKVQNGVNMERRERSQQSLTQTQNNVAFSEIAERRHTAQTEYESAIDNAKKAYEAFKAVDAKNRAEAGNDKDKIAAIDEAFGAETAKYTEKVEAIQKKKDDALALAKQQYDETMTQNRQALRDWYKKQVQLETQFQMKCGYGEETAFNIAVASVGKHSEQMLKNLVDAGQGDFVQTFLQELSKADADLKAIPRMGHDGKPAVNGEGKQMVDYEYDPNGRLCMSIDQVAGVQDYLNRKITADIQRNRLVAKQQEDAFDLEASKIRSEINQMDVLPTLDMERVKMLYEAANQLSAQGYDKAHLVTGNITSIVNRHARREQALQKMETKAAAAQTKELGDVAFRQMIDEFAARPDGVFTVDMMLPDDTGKPVLTKVQMNANNAIAHTIQTAQSLGFLKGANWTKRMGDALAVEGQRKIVEEVTNELFDFPISGAQTRMMQGNPQWKDRASGSSMYITVGLGANGSVRVANVGSNMRVRSKVAATVPGTLWGTNTEQRYLTSDQLNRVVAEAHRFVKDNPAATKESLMSHLVKARDEALLESDANSFGTRMMLSVTRANDEYFTRDIYGGMKDGRMVVARGRTPVGEMIGLSAMNARFNPAYSALTKNAIIFGDDEEPDLNAMQDEAVEE